MTWFCRISHERHTKLDGSTQTDVFSSAWICFRLANCHLLGIRDNKQHIRRLFTDTEMKESCRIGMSKEKFDKLNIPIIPVSRHLHEEDAKRMEKAGYGSWFDYLLVECTTREKGVGLLQIHKERLSHLPSNIEAPIKQYIEPRHLEHARKLANDHPRIGRLYLIIFRKLYLKYCRKHIVCAPRFEKAKSAKEQKWSNCLMMLLL